MIIGVLTEIKVEEYRVGITPEGAKILHDDGHAVMVEAGAGEGSGFTDADYRDAGAEIVEGEAVCKTSDLIIKVKEPLPREFDRFREGQALFTYLHLAPNRELTEMLLRKKITGLAYETLEKDGALPLLAPMSEIAGRISMLMGIYYLQKAKGGSGILATGATGVAPAKAVILGAGTVGANAAGVAIGIGMETVVLNKDTERLTVIDRMFSGKARTLPLSSETVDKEIRNADIIIGAILVPGGRTPVLITREMLKQIRKGSVIADVSVDQGGCVETTRPTTHADPVYTVDGIIHYAVANMPGAYPRTSTLALTNATLPYIRLIARMGIEKVIQENREMQGALNTYQGEIRNRALAEAMGAGD